MNKTYQVNYKPGICWKGIRGPAGKGHVTISEQSIGFHGRARNSRLVAVIFGAILGGLIGQADEFGGLMAWVLVAMLYYYFGPRRKVTVPWKRIEGMCLRAGHVVVEVRMPLPSGKDRPFALVTQAIRDVEEIVDPERFVEECRQTAREQGYDIPDKMPDRLAFAVAEKEMKAGKFCPYCGNNRQYAQLTGLHYWVIGLVVFPLLFLARMIPPLFVVAILVAGFILFVLPYRMCTKCHSMLSMVSHYLLKTVLVLCVLLVVYSLLFHSS
jgi:hypothetical protein